MRFISLILGFLLLIVVALFAMTPANQENIAFGLYPVFDRMEMMAWMWGFVLFAIGFLFGLFAAFNAGRRGRSQHRQARRELKSTSRDLKKRDSELAKIHGTDKKGDDMDPVALIGAS